MLEQIPGSKLIFMVKLLETLKRLISRRFPWEIGWKILSEVNFGEKKGKKRVQDDLKLVNIEVVQNVHQMALKHVEIFKIFRIPYHILRATTRSSEF